MTLKSPFGFDSETLFPLVHRGNSINRRKNIRIANPIFLIATNLSQLQKSCQLAHSLFFLPMTGANPLRGFIRPALRANRVETPRDLETPVILETCVVNP